MAEETLAHLAEDLIRTARIDERKAALLRQLILADGVIDRRETDLLFQINDAMAGRDDVAGLWRQTFVELIVDHLLEKYPARNTVTAEEAAYIESRIDWDGLFDLNEFWLVMTILKRADKTPESFQKFILEKIQGTLIKRGRLDDHALTIARRLIHSRGSNEGAGIGTMEAEFLLALNRAANPDTVSDEWEHFVTGALAVYITVTGLAAEVAEGELADHQLDWLLARFSSRKTPNPLERALLMHLSVQFDRVPDRLRALVEDEDG